MIKALPNWPGFHFSTNFKLLLDVEGTDYVPQTCCTYVQEL